MFLSGAIIDAVTGLRCSVSCLCLPGFSSSRLFRRSLVLAYSCHSLLHRRFGPCCGSGWHFVLHVFHVLDVAQHSTAGTPADVVDYTCTSSRDSARLSNQALERTAARCMFTFQMIKTVSVKATRALGGGRSACSR